jgi:ATP/maltotriose-dependent transcriptional regulator MalT
VVIRRKLAQPELGRDVVPRERLNTRIRALLERHQVVTVCATAGAGKTTAVALALKDIDRPVVWLSLDGTEKAAGRLLVYLEAAVERFVPEAGQVATDALSSSIQISEAAGLLAESLLGSHLVIVCDNVERITSEEGSAAVLSGLARYLPPDVSLVLISRTAVPLDIGSTNERSRVGELGERDLAFDEAEAGAVLQLIGQRDADARTIVNATGGWVTGVLFEGWRNADDEAGDPHALRGYLAANIFGTLTPAEQTFLSHTSLLSEVTIADAVTLGETNAGQLMASLRDKHLPVTWSPDGSQLTPHPQFREFLAEVLEEEDRATVEALRRKHAGLLLDQGAQEEAVDTLLWLGDVEAAWRLAAAVLPDLVARLDFAPAARWLDALGASKRTPTAEIGAVVLRVAFALEQVGRGVELLERHGYNWLPGPDSPDHEEALVLATWCLWHAGRIGAAAELAERLPPGRPKQIARTMVAQSLNEHPPPFPDHSPTPSGPVDGLLMRIAFTRGRLTELDKPHSFDPWRTVLGAPWVVAGLRATGRIDEAMAMYEMRRGSSQPLWLHAFDAVELMLDLGHSEEAWASLERGRRLIAKTGSQVYRILILLTEAKLCLRLAQDTEAADRVLAMAKAEGLDHHAFLRERGQLWRGLSLLLRDRNEEAREELSACVASMQVGDRRLELAAAAAYLAEAQWRLGEEDASDASAELALAVSADQGAQHLLLTALTDVPAVAVRSADAAPTRMSRWHELTALLASQNTLRVSSRGPRLLLEEFGEPTVTVDDRPTQPRLSKSIELLGYLIDAPGRKATRQQLLDALFEGGNDASGRSYLRQALYRLREAVPDELAPLQEDDRFRLAGTELVNGTAQMLLESLGQADRQDGEIRLRTLTGALAHADRGPYLATVSSSWAEQRRAEIEDRINSARFEAARLAFRLSRYREARQLLDELLRRNPYREQTWLLAISLAHATGSDDAVLALYQRYTAAMRELGVPPSAEAHRLVTQLRR